MACRSNGCDHRDELKGSIDSAEPSVRRSHLDLDPCTILYQLASSCFLHFFRAPGLIIDARRAHRQRRHVRQREDLLADLHSHHRGGGLDHAAAQVPQRGADALREQPGRA
eukprot:1287179-Rhodomonas_salina.2